MGTPPKKISWNPRIGGLMWFVDAFPFPKGHFSGSMLIFGGVCLKSRGFNFHPSWSLDEPFEGFFVGSHLYNIETSIEPP